ncbi:MAG: response regulator transcription factor [Hyphomicrobiales bacterium]|nr:response regulator transcription factor [Hyphomicrobiales bacterium]
MDRCSFATVLVGSCALFREGLARILSAAEFRIAAAASRVDDVTPGPLPQDQPILLILDVGTDQAATIKDIRLFKGQYPTSRVALVANHDQLSDSNIVAAFRAGADAYFLKPSCDTFIKSLELVILGETILPLEVLSYILHHYTEVQPFAETVAPLAANTVEPSAATIVSEADGKYAPRLSAREKCILRCLIEGDSNKAIARKNDIAEATVKVHVKAILRKIRVSNRTQAAIWAMNNDSFIGGMSTDAALAVTMAAEPSLRSSISAAPDLIGAEGSIAAAPIRQPARANGASHVHRPRAAPRAGWTAR